MIYSQVSAKLLSDSDWIDSTYLPVNHKRLQDAYSYVETRLTLLSIPVLKPSAGLFCWANFRSYIETMDTEGEMKLFRKLFDDEKVYIVPGSQFFCQQPGWFRIIFAVKQDILEAGLDKIEHALTIKQK